MGKQNLLYPKKVSSQQKSKAAALINALDRRKCYVRIISLKHSTLTVDLGFICAII
jgi:hypothetical protein